MSLLRRACRPGFHARLFLHSVRQAARARWRIKIHAPRPALRLLPLERPRDVSQVCYATTSSPRHRRIGRERVAPVERKNLPLNQAARQGVRAAVPPLWGEPATSCLPQREGGKGIVLDVARHCSVA